MLSELAYRRKEEEEEEEKEEKTKKKKKCRTKDDARHTDSDFD